MSGGDDVRMHPLFFIGSCLLLAMIPGVSSAVILRHIGFLSG